MPLIQGSHDLECVHAIALKVRLSVPTVLKFKPRCQKFKPRCQKYKLVRFENTGSRPRYAMVSFNI